jgi:hypothetical protein
MSIIHINKQGVNTVALMGLRKKGAIMEKRYENKKTGRRENGTTC